jgi:predicted metal-dependent phosphoesterase TrpH
VIDLHTHSTASDGSETPARVVKLAAEAGIGSLALTDHDTQQGIAEAAAEADRLGIDLIPGTEISAEFDRGAMHLIILFLTPGPGPLQNRLAELRSGRDGRNARILERLADLGVPVSPEEVLELAGGESVGRPHIAAAMMRRGYVETIGEAFERYLARGQPAYENRWRMKPEEAISLAIESGAVAVLAHPHTLGLDRSEEVSTTLSGLADAGLRAMECYYPAYSPLEQEGYVALAERFGLAPSGGSDFHGTYKPGVSLGVGRGNLIVPDGVLDRLRPT